MVITLISIGILILGIVCFKADRDYTDFFEITGIASCIIGSIAVIACIGCIIGAHIGVDMKIEENRIKYESLCKRYEIISSEYEDVSKSDVIRDISEWNAEVMKAKYWQSNTFTNWFWSKRVVDNMEAVEVYD